jgi:hypothetical protein
MNDRPRKFNVILIGIMERQKVSKMKKWSSHKYKIIPLKNDNKPTNIKKKKIP